MCLRKFTVLSDGSSDRVLLPILQWMLGTHHAKFDWQGSVADLSSLPNPPKNFHDRITTAIEYYPCDVLFIHRDAEKQKPSLRREEIHQAVSASGITEPWTPVVPVRMTEAWLLISESAVRETACNPKGSNDLKMPPIARLEAIPDPKRKLKELLEKASEQRGRRLEKLHFPTLRAQLPHHIQDWTDLLKLPSAKATWDDIARLQF